MDVTKQPGIRCKNIILMNSVFHREEKYSVQKVSNQINFDQNIEISEDQKNAVVSLKVILTQKSEEFETEQLRLEATYSGIFQVDGENANMTLDSFCENSAPAILVPYIRQHIHELSVKASIPVILLPPINITAIKKVSK